MWYLCIAIFQMMRSSDAIYISIVPSLLILVCWSCHEEQFLFQSRRTTSHMGITNKPFPASYEIIVVNQPFLALFVKSVFFSHHSVHFLYQQGCQHLMLVVLFVGRVSRGFSPTLLTIWHVNLTTCCVSMQWQRRQPPSQTTAKWTPLKCHKGRGLHFARAAQS